MLMVLLITFLDIGLPLIDIRIPRKGKNKKKFYTYKIRTRIYDKNGSSHYSKISSKRYLVKPGIISLAQVYGGRKLSYQDTLKCDIEYYDNYSLWFDIKIFFKSLKTISKRSLGR